MKLIEMNDVERLEKKWVAVYCRPRWELKVSKSLMKLGLETFCPLKKELRQWSDRKKTIHLPLFPNYVFVRSDSNHFPVIRRVAGIVNLVYWLNSPAVIRDEEIEIIKRFTKEYQFVESEKSVVNVGDRVTILSGPLMHRDGNVLEIKHKSIKVSLPNLGYNLIARVEKSQIDILTQYSEKTSLA